MKRRDFLKKLGIGVAVAPAVPAILSEAAKAEPTVYTPEKPSYAGASASYGGDHTHSISHDGRYDHSHGVPVGTICPYYNGVHSYRIYTDIGWLPCDGRYVMTDFVPTLNRTIGTAYGGYVNFIRLPNLH